MATTSSGLTPLWGSFWKISLTMACTAGMRVLPPTRMTSSMSLGDSPASLRAFKQGLRLRSIKSATICSKRARDRFICKCLGPEASAVMYGRLIEVSLVLDSSILAFSAASLRRCKAILSLDKSIPVSCLKPSTIHSMTRWSKSSPPKWVSPLVDLTSNTPSPSSRMEISKVPPPKSYTAIFSSLLVSLPNPYANAAAVGSFTMRFTSKPAILPASLVAWRWESLKYAGTVMTASTTSSPK